MLLLALLIGIVAGSRTMTAPAAAAFAARYTAHGVAATKLAFMGYALTPWIFGVLAACELVIDTLPSTPSRKTPPQFAARIATGMLSGATMGAAGSSLLPGVAAGAIGAAIGTLGGATLRGGLAAMFGRDLPAALIEDAIALGGGTLIVLAA
jgi:uncharacterized membrane protein